MKNTLECVDGTKITYKLPNIIELFELQGECGWGTDASGFTMISKILKNAEPFIVSVKGKKNWAECLETRKLSTDLSNLALALVKDSVDDEVKKS